MKIRMEDGKILDTEKAVKFSCKDEWNGRDWECVNTGSIFSHQTLYVSRSGQCVLCRWSRYEHVNDVYEYVSNEEAVAWLLANGYVEKDMPAFLQECLEENEEKIMI